MTWPKYKRQLSELEEKIGYRFKDRKLLYEALTHKSVLQDKPHMLVKTYERLEFLGDAVMEFLISDYYYFKYPKASEGVLTDFRTRVVNGTTLVLFSKALKLEDFIILSSSIRKITDNILEDTFESLLGAIYVDGGLEPAQKFLTQFLEKVKLDDLLTRHPKNELQEYIQSIDDHGSFNYQLTRETGPDNDKTFYVDIVYQDKVIGKGVGKSKKEAETQAAQEALKKVKHERK